MVLLYLNLLLIIYQGGQRPFNTAFKNRIELINEVTICICTLHMMLFTDFVTSHRGQDYAGWSMVIIMTLNFVINLMVVVKIGASSLGLVVKKYWKIFEKKFITKKEEMPENSSNS